MTALRLNGDSLRLPLKPLAQKSEVGLECDKPSGNSRAWLPKKSSSLSTKRKIRTTVGASIQMSAPSCQDGPAWPCTGALYPCMRR
jgi:hypothetical protein